MDRDPQPAPPPDLPTDPQLMWQPPATPDALPLSADPTSRPALEQLGASPFPRGGFPILGFLASVYEHVAARARHRRGGT